MEIKELERLISDEINKVLVRIIEEKTKLPISAKARAGAEISDYLEKKFVQYTQQHTYLKRSEFAPEGQTKNEWDARTFFCINGHEEEIWIDFKALKISSKDSNPDIGTPDKIIDFIRAGNFYLLYVHVYYQECEEGLEFVKISNRYTKTYFLKDISSTFRRNPKNQLQVNMSAEPEYRTREEFIKLFITKIRESHHRQIENSNKRLSELPEIQSQLIDINSKTEKSIQEKIL